MTSIKNHFELNIPTHISFTLYKFDYIDSIIISKVLAECKNLNGVDAELYTVDATSFKFALQKSKRLTTEIIKFYTLESQSANTNKPNSIFFLWSIFSKLEQIELLTFNISYDKDFTRLIKTEKREYLSFYFKINEGVFNLTEVFDRKSLDIINKKIIKSGVLSNEYLDRLSYFYMKTTDLFLLLEELESEGLLNTFELLDGIDHKLEEDNPILLVITDYTPY
jgi:hypothetical protein